MATQGEGLPVKRLGKVVERLGLGLDPADPFVAPEDNQAIIEATAAEKRLAEITAEYRAKPPVISPELRKKLGLQPERKHGEIA
jgi:hypothetical protein